MRKKTTIDQIKQILKVWGFSRKEARLYIKSLRKEAQMDEKEFIHSEEE